MVVDVEAVCHPRHSHCHPAAGERPVAGVTVCSLVVCVCVCARVCVYRKRERVCVCACPCVCIHVCTWICVCVCVCVALALATPSICGRVGASQKGGVAYHHNVSLVSLPSTSGTEKFFPTEPSVDVPITCRCNRHHTVSECSGGASYIAMQEIGMAILSTLPLPLF